jgi:hypothetical protein
LAALNPSWLDPTTTPRQSVFSPRLSADWRFFLSQQEKTKWLTISELSRALADIHFEEYVEGHSDVQLYDYQVRVLSGSSDLDVETPGRDQQSPQAHVKRDDLEQTEYRKIFFWQWRQLSSH